MGAGCYDRNMDVDLGLETPADERKKIQDKKIMATQSIFNSRTIIANDIGSNKKIFIRQDKIDFKKQSDDIFE